MRFRPDGGVVLPAGERVTIEVELHAGTAGRLATALPWNRYPAGYAGVLWPVPDPGVETPLWAAMAGVDPEAGLMAVERLRTAALAFAGGWHSVPVARSPARAARLWGAAAAQHQAIVGRPLRAGEGPPFDTPAQGAESLRPGWATPPSTPPGPTGRPCPSSRPSPTPWRPPPTRPDALRGPAAPALLRCAAQLVDAGDLLEPLPPAALAAGVLAEPLGAQFGAGGSGC